MYLAQSNPDALLLLAPSDHAIADPADFRAAVKRGQPAAEAGQIVTFGIQPSRPETGYGWLEAGTPTYPGVNRLDRFIEKPDALRAAALFADPRYLWNAGVFLIQAKVLIAAFTEHAPAILAGVRAALTAAVPDLGFTRIDPTAWAGVPEDSIDYAVMGKARNVSVVRFEGAWSDLGSWESVWQDSPRDEADNAAFTPCHRACNVKTVCCARNLRISS